MLLSCPGSSGLPQWFELQLPQRFVEESHQMDHLQCIPLSTHPLPTWLGRMRCLQHTPQAEFYVGCLYGLAGIRQGRHWVADQISAEKTKA